MPDLRARFRALRYDLAALETPDLSGADRDGALAPHGLEVEGTPSRSRRIVALVAAFAIFLGTAGVFGWRLTHPTPLPLQEPSPSAGLQTVEGVVPPEPRSGSIGALLAMDFPNPDHGYLVRCTAGAGRCTQADLWVSSDGGDTWRVQTTKSPETISFVDEAVGFGLTRTCEGTCGFSVVSTTDAGSTWNVVGNAGSASALGEAFAASRPSIAFVDESHGWVVNGVHLFDSTDGARTWNELSDPCSNGWGLVSASLVDASTGFAACEGEAATAMAPKEILRTTDGGATWTIVSAAGRSVGGGSGPDVGSLEITGYNSRLRFVSEQVGFLLTDRGGVDRTTDGGVTFRRIVLTDDLYSPVDVAWPGSGRGYLALSSGELLETVDGGSTWSQSFPSPQASVSEPFAFANERTGVAVGSSGIIVSDGDLPSTTGLFATDDGGLSWTDLQEIEAVDGPTLPGVLQMVSPEVIFAQAGAPKTAIYRSSDAGQTWQEISLPGDASPGSMSWVDRQTGFVLSGRSVFRTTNGGEEWSQVGIEAPILEMDSASASDLWGVSSDPQPSYGGKLWHSTDGGTTWTQIEPIAGFHAGSVSAFDALHIWVEGVTCTELSTRAERADKPNWCAGESEMVLLSTSDGGGSWQAVSLPHLFEGMQFVSPTTGFAYDSRLLITHDAGVTWRKVGSSEP